MSSVLAEIQGPDDVKKLSRSQLLQLAEDIRQRIIDITSKCGGHIAPSLGVVELTVALHSVLESPRDKIIWDVGHQSYAHKLLTGRNEQLDTLRSLNGVSGFPRPSESEHDAFATGHASTSISAALGMAKARDLREEDYRVVAVIGDGAMTGGLAFEGLNNAGSCKSDLIVILNDNSMSISPNVGSIATYLNRIRSDPTYSRLKSDLESIIKRLPVIGNQVNRGVERVKDSLKYLVLPGMLFEELGFTYLGPIDGHDISTLQSVLRNACQNKGPVLVHLVTRKGRGYEPAESRPEAFHGTGPFDPTTGDSLKKKKKPSYSALFGKALCDLADRDPAVVAITAAMPDGTGLSEFCQRFPDRVFDVGIAEGHAATFAAGLASCGMKPVVAIYSTFLQRAFDHIIHDVCLQELPVVFALDRAGIVGEDGSTHQGAFDLSYLRCIPNMTIGVPSTGTELRDMLATAVQLNRPVAIRYPRDSSDYWQGDVRLLKPPGCEWKRSGRDVTLIACGPMVDSAMKAADILSSFSVDAGVVNMRWVKPLDIDALHTAARNSDLIVTVEENTVTGGLGSAVLEAVSSTDIDVAVRCLGINDQFVEHGKRGEILDLLGLSPQKISERIISFLGESGMPRALRV